MALLDIVMKGTTDYSTTVRFVDSADGTPETGVVAATAGLSISYRRGAASGGTQSAAVTLASGAAINDLAALTTAHTDSGIKHIGDGYYRVDLPDAAIAAGAQWCEITGTATDMIMVGGRILLTATNHQDDINFGITALPEAAAGADGGLPLGDANGRVDVSQWVGNNVATPNTAGVPQVDVTYWSGTATTISATSAKPEVDTYSISDDAAAANSLEAAVEGTTPIPANLTQWKGAAPANLSNTYVQSSAQEIANALITAAAVATDAIDADALAADGIAEIVADIMTEVVETQGSYTVQQVLSVMFSALAGVTSNSGNTLKTPDGVATRITATVSSNERTAMTIAPSS